ncbi:MAG: PHP domain-containing protein, partial [Flavobacteriia bacterium]|nr:PHP domain-containing protein [Flavobacteriia bacterium]
MFLIFDTETTGLPRNYNAPITDTSNWPRVVQLAWQLHDEFGQLIEQKDFLIRPRGFNIPIEAEGIHGISTELASIGGDELEDVLLLFKKALLKTKFIVGHNLKFDVNVLGCEFCRIGEETPLTLPILDTCTEKTAELCRLPGGPYGKFKLPTLIQLHDFLFNKPFSEAHNATADVEATTRCFLELIRQGNFSLEQLSQGSGFIEEYRKINPSPIQSIELKHLNLKLESTKLREAKKVALGDKKESKNEIPKELKDTPFAHLHNHSKFTILQSTSEVQKLVEKAAELNMPAVALTDTGNMMAAFHFEKAANKYNLSIKEEREQANKDGLPFDKNEILPIIGCEFNVCADLNDKSQKDNGYQVVFLAKNKAGYQNLIKLASIAYTKGMYYVPRIDKKLIEEYKSDIIVLSGNLYGEIPNLILNVGENQAEGALIWWKNTFKDDFYIELSRHNLEIENRVNTTLVELAHKHDVKIVATNNTFYLSQHDAQAHDVLLCVKDNELVETPKGRGRGFRYGLENDQYYFKSSDEMKALFSDLPEAIITISEILSKCEHYPLAREVLLPAFDIPAEFISKEDANDEGKRGENNYLKHLTLKGAEKRYGEISDELLERIEFELATIEKTNYPGYFLIVQDFC